MPSTLPLLSVRAGRTEDVGDWILTFREVPHWLIAGATQSGKSTLLSAVVAELAQQPVALVGIDCKGGLELGIFESRLSALACTPKEAVQLLARLERELQSRMRFCRSMQARGIWDLDSEMRPDPIVVLVDEVAELYLSDGSKESRDLRVQCSTLLLRVAQLGAALGIHLVIAGQRIGSELGPGVTALRAQLGGRVCHAVHDAETAEMTLGDLAPEAVELVQRLSSAEKGVAIAAVSGEWRRVRSTRISREEAKAIAETHAGMTPYIRSLLEGGEL
ncbi:FtsK/SpoIIIE domain-containing protein [Streptomyces buecherae]|uniref:FtsK/SpoIIIE domain-containing protein n=1 Tax=Streptomyces buecherae TaxID=2763006 RepID=UPI0036B08B6E